MLLLVIILVGVIIYLLRRRPSNYSGGMPMNNSGMGGMGGFGHGMGGMMTGALLGYLLSEALISPHQYDAWQNMNADELRQTLGEQGIMTPEQFDNASQRLDSNQSSWNDSSDSMSDDFGSGSDSYNDFDGFGGGDDSF